MSSRSSGARGTLLDGGHPHPTLSFHNMEREWPVWAALAWPVWSCVLEAFAKFLWLAGLFLLELVVAGSDDQRLAEQDGSGGDHVVVIEASDEQVLLH